MEHAKLIAVRIEEARYERGMSVAELGRRASIDRKRLWYILDGQRQMRADEFVRLCVVLDMGLRNFLTAELEELIGHLTDYRNALRAKDTQRLHDLLKEGRELKATAGGN